MLNENFSRSNGPVRWKQVNHSDEDNDWPCELAPDIRRLVGVRVRLVLGNAYPNYSEIHDRKKHRDPDGRCSDDCEHHASPDYNTNRRTRDGTRY